MLGPGDSSRAAKKHLPLVFCLFPQTVPVAPDNRDSAAEAGTGHCLGWQLGAAAFPLVIKISFTDTFNGQDISQCIVGGNRWCLPDSKGVSDTCALTSPNLFFSYTNTRSGSSM